MAPRARMQAHPLFESIFEGDESAVRRIIASDPACVNTPESSGMTALMLCASYKRPELARILLAQGADLRARERRGGLTALHLAAWSHCAPLVKVLIDEGAPVDEVDDNGNSALQQAVALYTRGADGGTFEVLLKAGADPHLKNKWGDSPVESARRSEQGSDRFFANLPDGG